MHTTIMQKATVYYPVSTLLQVLSQYGFKKNALKGLDYEVLVALSKVKLGEDFTPEVIAEINKVLAPCGKTFEDIAW